jgi:hypothetical protein
VGVEAWKRNQCGRRATVTQPSASPEEAPPSPFDVSGTSLTVEEPEGDTEVLYLPGQLARSSCAVVEMDCAIDHRPQRVDLDCAVHLPRRCPAPTTVASAPAPTQRGTFSTRTLHRWLHTHRMDESDTLRARVMASDASGHIQLLTQKPASVTA